MKAFVVANKRDFFFVGVALFVMGQMFGKELMQKKVFTPSQLGYSQQEAPPQLQASRIRAKKKED